MSIEKKPKEHTAPPKEDLDVIMARISRTQEALAQNVQAIKHEMSPSTIKTKTQSEICVRAVSMIFEEGTTPEQLKTNTFADSFRAVRPEVYIAVAATTGLAIGLLLVNRAFRD